MNDFVVSLSPCALTALSRWPAAMAGRRGSSSPATTPSLGYICFLIFSFFVMRKIVVAGSGFRQPWSSAAMAVIVNFRRRDMRVIVLYCRRRRWRLSLISNGERWELSYFFIFFKPTLAYHVLCNNLWVDELGTWKWYYFRLEVQTYGQFDTWENVKLMGQNAANVQIFCFWKEPIASEIKVECLLVGKNTRKERLKNLVGFIDWFDNGVKEYNLRGPPGHLIPNQHHHLCVILSNSIIISI